MYVPPNCPFAEENLEDGTVGLVFKAVFQEVAYGANLHEHMHRHRNFGYMELALKYKLFEPSADQPSSSGAGVYMSLADFKAQQ